MSQHTRDTFCGQTPAEAYDLGRKDEALMSGWRPVTESEPGDRERVLVPHRGKFQPYRVAWRIGKYEWRCSDARGEAHELPGERPRFWMPIPPLPSEEPDEHRCTVDDIEPDSESEGYRCSKCGKPAVYLPGIYNGDLRGGYLTILPGDDAADDAIDRMMESLPSEEPEAPCGKPCPGHFYEFREEEWRCSSCGEKMPSAMPRPASPASDPDPGVDDVVALLDEVVKKWVCPECEERPDLGSSRWRFRGGEAPEHHHGYPVGHIPAVPAAAPPAPDLGDALDALVAAAEAEGHAATVAACRAFRATVEFTPELAGRALGRVRDAVRAALEEAAEKRQEETAQAPKDWLGGWTICTRCYVGMTWDVKTGDWRCPFCLAIQAHHQEAASNRGDSPVLRGTGPAIDKAGREVGEEEAAPQVVGHCRACMGPVYQHPDRPGEFDHECKESGDAT